MAKTETQKKDNRKKGAIIGVSVASALAVAGAVAYLTDTKTVTNKLSVDTNFQISLTEPAWKTTDTTPANGIPDAAENLAPMETIAKDPTITNTGSVEGWMAMKVKMPVFTGQILNDKGKPQDVTDYDLYSYTVKSGWTEVAADTTVKNGFREYTYVRTASMAPGDKATLFDNVTVANLTNKAVKDIDATTNPTGTVITANQIEIEAYGIQKEGFTSATDAYAAFKAQKTAAVVAGS